MRARFTVALGVALALILTGWTGSAATAVDPGPLDPGFVTDHAGVLTTSEADAAEQELDELRTEHGVNLFVVYVDYFTNPSDVVDWTNEVYDLNNLGPHQYLLAVATEGRAYYLDAHVDGELSDAQLTQIEHVIQSSLERYDWAGAISVAVDQFAAILDADTPATTDPGGGTTTPNRGGGGGVLLLLGGLAALALVIWLIVRARKKSQQKAQALASSDVPYAGVSDKELERMAGSALVATDDAVTSSREELGFAIAQFGDASTETFTGVVDQAAQRLSEAFSLKQKLDDEIPDTDEQRRAWHIQILDLCEAAQELLDDNLEAFDALRKLEQNAPEALASVRAEKQKLDQKLDAAPGVLTALSARFSADALGTVVDNPQQARDRLQLAANHITEAEGKLAAGVTGEAAFAIRIAEEGVVQAAQLLGALDTIGNDLQAIEQQAHALIADLETDLAAAAQLSDSSGQLASIAAQTRSSVERARVQLQASPRNPQLVLDALDATNTQIDQSIAHVRNAIEQERRRRQALEQKLLQAQSQIRAASDYIATRRGAVSSTPRTRLAEAEASLSQAMSMQQTSPDQALQYATRAYDLASRAIRAAENEIGAFQSNSGWGGSSLGSDILGGIIGGIISGGGNRRSSSWGGSSSRSSGWGGSSSRSSWSGGSRGRSGGSSFRSSGGGSRRRSGGGRF